MKSIPTILLLLCIVQVSPALAQDAPTREIDKDPSVHRLLFFPTARIPDYGFLHVDLSYFAAEFKGSSRQGHGLGRFGVYLPDIAMIEVWVWGGDNVYVNPVHFSIKGIISDNGSAAFGAGITSYPVQAKYAGEYILSVHLLGTFYNKIGVVNIGIGPAIAPEGTGGVSAYFGGGVNIVSNFQFVVDAGGAGSNEELFGAALAGFRWYRKHFSAQIALMADTIKDGIGFSFNVSASI